VGRQIVAAEVARQANAARQDDHAVGVERLQLIRRVVERVGIGLPGINAMPNLPGLDGVIVRNDRIEELPEHLVAFRVTGVGAD